MAWFLVCAGALLAGPARLHGEAAASPTREPVAPLTTATGLLAACVATLPHEPLDLAGVISVRKQRGIIVAEHPFRLHLDWGASPSRVRCDLLDDAGAVQERFTITRPKVGPADLELRIGPEQALQPMPALSTPVCGTDMTWLDLSLDFLWWTDARLDGQESVLDHTCDVVVVTPPRPIPGCAAVRLYLESKMRCLMRAEEVDAQGRALRKMSVRSVKKFKDRWLIGEMEVETVGGSYRTRLRVDDVSSP